MPNIRKPNNKKTFITDRVLSIVPFFRRTTYVEVGIYFVVPASV